MAGEQQERGKLPSPRTIIPDRARIVSQLSIRSQVLNIDYGELSPYFDWIQEQAKSTKGDALLVKGARMTMNNLKPGDEAWENIVASGKDEQYTLGRCITENANSCFQREVFFNLLIQQADVPCATLEGSWVESSRADLRDKPDDILIVKPGGYTISSQDRYEGHLWNLAQIDEKYYLVDSSYLVEQNGRQEPVIQEIDYEPGQNYFKIPLPSGETRHYIADGPIKIQEGKPTQPTIPEEMPTTLEGLANMPTQEE